MAIAQAYREKLQNPQAALDLYRDWLKTQARQAERDRCRGPVALAALYEELLQDQAAARELLERAWKIDPGSKEVAEAFRTRGYRLVKDQWVEAARRPRPERRAAPTGAECAQARAVLAPGAAGQDPRRGPPADRLQARPERFSPAPRASSSSSGFSWSRPGGRFTSSTSSARRASFSPGLSPIIFCPVRPSTGSSSRRVDSPRCTFFATLAIFSLIFRKSAAECGGFPAPISFLSRLQVVPAPSLSIRDAVLPALNSFGVSNSKVANEAGKNPKDFVKPLVGSDVLLLSIGKLGTITCRWRIMCLTEGSLGRTMWVGTRWLVIRIACPDLSNACVSYHPSESDLYRSSGRLGNPLAMRVCRSDPAYQ